MKMRRHFCICLAAALCLTAAGCGSSQPADTDEAALPASSQSDKISGGAVSSVLPNSSAASVPPSSRPESSEPADTSETPKVSVYSDPNPSPGVYAYTTESTPAVSAPPGPTEDPAPVTFTGGLSYTEHTYSADKTLEQTSVPGRVCKSRAQLEALVEELAPYDEDCVEILNICDDAFFSHKALVFASAPRFGTYGDSLYNARRTSEGIQLYADAIRSYGLPGWDTYDILYFLEVDSGLVSVHDSADVIHQTRDWAAVALPDGQRVEEEGLLVPVYFMTDDNYDGGAYITVKEFEDKGLRGVILRSEEELDAWLAAVTPCFATDWQLTENTLAQQIAGLQVDFKTSALVVWFEEGVDEYLGASVSGSFVTLGMLAGSGGCTPDYNYYLALQPIRLDELGDAVGVVSSVV